MNRIFITGDTHGGQRGDLSKLSSKNFPEGKKLTKDDFVIITGDFGLLYDQPHNIGSQEKYYTNWLTEKKWTTLFIDGNHENFDRLYALPQVKMFGGIVGKVNDSIYHLRRGCVYTIGGKTFFTFGGGHSFDKMERTEFISWWHQEQPTNEEYERGLNNLTKVNNEVDYIITHTGSHFMFDLISAKHRMGRKSEGERQIRNYFNMIEDKVNYKKWYCGHFHIDEKIYHYNFMYNKVVEL